MSFDVVLRNPGSGFNVAFGEPPPPPDSKIFVGDVPVTIPGLVKVMLGSEQLWPVV